MAELFFKKTIAVCDSFQVHRVMPAALVGLAKVRLAMKDAEDAIALGRRGLDVAERTQNLPASVEATDLLERAYHAAGKPDSAYVILKLHAALHDSLVNAEDYNVIGIGDIFNSSKVFDNETYLGNSFVLRMDNSLIYTTPNFSGFSAQAMLVMNGSCTPSDPVSPTELCRSNADNKLPSNLSDDIDMWNIGLSYKNGPFFIGGTYMALEGDEFPAFATRPTWDGDQWGLAFGYNSGAFALTFAYEDGDVNTLNIGKTQNYYLTGQYTFGPNVIRAAYGFSSPDDSRIPIVVNNAPVDLVQDDANNWVLGYQYNFSKRTRVWVEYVGRISTPIWSATSKPSRSALATIYKLERA